MKLNNYKSAIILPYKENFCDKGFGAVSIWVKDFIDNSSNINDLIFCRRIPKIKKYLTNNVKPVKIQGRIYTNLNYIKNINFELIKQNIQIVEIHNRPEYAVYLIKNNPKLKVNLVFHNDPNLIRDSNKTKHREFLLNNCNKIIFVSKWVKKRFFENLKDDHKNNTEIIYNFINPINKLPKKKKTIIFSGKLNISKGFHIFCKSVINILDKYPDWNAEVYGNEQRETFSFRHKRLKINNWIDHKKLLKIYEKASISVVNPTWQEPFGRTALESASRGCAVITSISGGLKETFNNNLVLKKNNITELTKTITKLIENKDLLLKIQNDNFKNVIHKPKITITKLNYLRNSYFKKLIKKNRSFKVLHISNFGQKNSHRLFNLSIAKKLSNGFIRNGHDVIDFDYRMLPKKLFRKSNIDEQVLEISSNYRPDLILFGHNNSLNRSTLEILKKNYECKFSIWYEDHVMKGDPNYKKNLDLLEKNNDLIDEYFITTSPDIIKTKIPKSKLNYLPIPVDANIEEYDFSEIEKNNDLFFALSHGVNYGKLKDNTFDKRSIFVKKIIKQSNNEIKFNIFGLYNEQPKWNYDFNNVLKLSKTALNLSRGGPSKYCSSNRIASLMGNGVLPLIDEKVNYQDFFDNDEILTYKNEKDLVSKLIMIKEDKKKLIKRSKNAKKSYFAYFENTIVADSIIHKIFNTKKNFRYIWKID
jgi:glycosyltransferase involved in cell wall biosynthesis